MATNPVEDQVYPFSTRDAQSIPLEIIDPQRLIWRTADNSGGAVGVTLPSDFQLGFVYSTGNCFLKFNSIPQLPGDFPQNVPIVDTLFLPANTLMTVRFMGGPCAIVPIGSGTINVYFQEVRKWNTLALKQQARVK